MKRIIRPAGILMVTALLPLFAAAQEKVDLSVVQRIKAEAFRNSKVMDTLFYLTDVYGPRLANSPGFREAGNWAVERLQDWGLSNVHKEVWGPFGRGWVCSRFTANLVAPQAAPLIGYSVAWTASTSGPVKGEPIYAPLRTEEDFAKYKGKLRGRIVLFTEPREIGLVTVPYTQRHTDASLAELAETPDPSRPLYWLRSDPRMTPMPAWLSRPFRRKVTQFLIDEGVAFALTVGYTGDGGTVFAAPYGSRDPKDPVPPPIAALTPEHYNRIVRLLEHKVPVQLELESQSRIIDDTTDSFNIISEIPGGSKKDEVVLVGAHLDSWEGGTGATDDGTGCAVIMEAARILKTLNLPMDRTVRFALWGAEEEGLLGSKAYVRQHLGNPDTMELKPEHAKLDVYFNYDNGAGKIRGVYLQDNDALKPIFEAWLQPFHDLGAATAAILSMAGSDQGSFEGIGVPDVPAIQDRLEYATRTHHSNMDVYDHVPSGDLMQSAAVLASLAYDAANRPQMLPRKPLPKAKPKS